MLCYIYTHILQPSCIHLLHAVPCIHTTHHPIYICCALCYVHLLQAVIYTTTMHRIFMVNSYLTCSVLPSFAMTICKGNSTSSLSLILRFSACGKDFEYMQAQRAMNTHLSQQLSDFSVTPPPALRVHDAFTGTKLI